MSAIDGIRKGAMFRFSCEKEMFGRKHRWFIVGRYVTTYFDKEGVERVLVEEPYTDAKLHLLESSVKGVT